MDSNNSEIKSLASLSLMRSAPELDNYQSKCLEEELLRYMSNADWFTIGIMAPNFPRAIFVLREMENRFNWPAMELVSESAKNRPVFLKANQKTGDIYVRQENGLGEGILLCCQHDEDNNNSETFGPFPLDFFMKSHQKWTDSQD